MTERFDGNAGSAATVSDLLFERLGVEASDPDVDLIETGLVDSLALVNLIVAIEDAFNCQLPLDGFSIDRFRSPQAIVEFLAELDVLPRP